MNARGGMFGSRRGLVAGAPGHVWAIAPDAQTKRRTSDVTGIFHASVDCPALRKWVDLTKGASANGTILEIDPVSWLYWPWIHDAGKWQAEDEPEGYLDEFQVLVSDSDWRPCLRCGSVPSVSPKVCSRCFLTACDCG